MKGNGTNGNGHAKNGRDIKDIWKEYQKRKSEPLRNCLIEHYLHLVRYNAERIHVKLPDEVDLDDLMSAGIFGLMDAIAAYDLERCVKFETYCAPRIRGAILDELRSMDWVPRLTRSRAHKISGASRQLEMELGRLPSDDELARRLRISQDELRVLQGDSTEKKTVSLSRKWYETDSGKDVVEGHTLTDPNAVDPVLEAERQDLKELILTGLGRQERLVIILHYFEELTFSEVGEVLDLCESRVSQMHTAIMERLANKMKLRWLEQ